MWIIKGFIEKPMLALVVSLLLLIGGYQAFKHLPLTAYPNLQNPEIGIHTSLPGASASFMENEVSRIIETGVSDITGIESVESNSQVGVSNVIVRFNLNQNIDTKINQLNAAIGKLRDKLPADIDGPSLHQANPNDKPMMTVFFSSDKLSIAALTDYVSRSVQPQLQQIPGVSQIVLQGGQDFSVRIWVNPAKMATLHVTLAEIIAALKSQNVESPGGTFQMQNRAYPVVTNALVSSPKEFANLIISHKDGKTIRFRDVATVKLGVTDDKSQVLQNGKPGIAIGVIVSSVANPLAVAEHVRQLLPGITQNLPSTMHLSIGYDYSQFLSQSISSVYDTLFYAILLVILITLLFVGSLRAAIIPIVVIPLSLFGTFIVMYLAGFNLNILTLLALVLAIGLVVDDAIVVMENIHRHRQQGLSAAHASLQGASEIFHVVISITLVVAAVYLPIGFMQGFVGKLFWQFAFTLSVAVILSGAIAISITPVMCRYLLPSHAKQSRYAIASGLFFARMTSRYRGLLSTVFKHKPAILILLSGLFGVLILLFILLPKALAPDEDQGFIVIPFNAPSNASFSFTQRYAQQLDAAIKHPAISQHITAIGFPSTQEGQVNLTLLPRKQRKLSQQQLATEIEQSLAKIPGIDAHVSPPPPLGIDGQGGFPIEFILRYNGSYSALNTIAKQVQAAMARYPGFANISGNLKWNSLQYNLSVNRELAGDLGVNVSNITTLLTTMLGGYTASQYLYQGKSYDVIVQAPATFSPGDLQQFYVQTRNGSMMPIHTLVTSHTSTEPLVLSHFNRMRSEHITATLKTGYAIGSAVRFLQHTLPGVLPTGAEYQFFGQTRNYLSSQGTLLQSFGFAILVIFLILLVQFESFREPLIILFSIPLTLVGALLALFVSHNSLNIFSEIGLIALVGLISKHAIMMLAQAKRLRLQGETAQAAIINAACLRLQPILMTSAAIIFGAIPLILASEGNAASQQQLGWVICGGLSLGTLFTLLILPVIYLLFTPNNTA